MQGMVSLTFDDGLAEHLDHVVPILKRHNITGTFYVHLTAETFLTRRRDWQCVSEDGHELGNHTIFHPASERKKWVRQGNAIESYSLDRIEMEIETANRMLQSIDGIQERTFAYPCSYAFVGRPGWPVRLLEMIGLQRTRLPGIVQRSGLDFGSTLVSYQPSLKRIVTAARGGGLILERSPPPLSGFSRYSLLSAAITGHTLHQIREFIERSLANQTWAILQFHGVGGGHSMDCDLDVFRGLVRWLAEHHAESVCTVRSGAQRLWPATEGTADLTESVKTQIA